MTDPDLLDADERRYRADPDPWNQRTSRYERDKRTATLAACGDAERDRILELGAGNGVLAATLAPLGRQLVAIEAVPSAAALARERLAALDGVTLVEGLVPHVVPAQTYDLVVASEILFYLDEPSYRMTLRLLSRWLPAGGRLVAVHGRRAHPKRPRSADLVHADLFALRGMRRIEGNGSAGADYRLDVFEPHG